MDNNLNKSVQAFLNSDRGAKISGSSDTIERIANSADGKKVKDMINSNRNFSSAIESGDVNALKNALNDILKTDVGARIYSQLNDILK